MLHGDSNMISSNRSNNKDKDKENDKDKDKGTVNDAYSAKEGESNPCMSPCPMS